MKPGDVVMWLDQGPAIILCKCLIPSPNRKESFKEFLNETWEEEDGWTIKLILTNGLLDVHEDTLHDSIDGDPGETAAS